MTIKWRLKFWDYYYDNLHRSLQGKPNVFPQVDKWFRALELTPYDEVKVVILGQDPYHTKGYAEGLAFSVQPHVKHLPRSLQNIFHEYTADLGYPWPRSGSLVPWATRGVLLLNTILTVEEGKPLSHKGLGWEKLTYEIMTKLSEKKDGLVFILWGREAQQWRGRIDEDKHLVIASSHPSPYSAKLGFFGSKPFSRTNEYLKDKVDWRLS